MKSLFLFFLGFPFVLFSQPDNTLPKQNLSLSFGRAFHGTGDLRGIWFAADYGKFLKKKWEGTAGFTTTIHSDAFPLLVTYPNSSPVDASYRSVAAGLQANGCIHYVPLRTRHHELKAGAGVLVRYQSSSVSSGYGVYYPAGGTGFPEPVFTFRNNEKQNTLSAGYQVSLGYAFTLRNHFLLGGQAGFQNDTNADVITRFSLRLGKRF